LRVADLAAAVCLLTPLGLARPAVAQVSASLSLDSDYRFRGLSLSDRQPVASLNLGYDHDSGTYAGASAIVVDTTHAGVQMLGYVAYAGFVARPKSGPALDFGVTGADVNEYADKRYTYNYGEIYAGLIGDRLRTHVYYSPNYFGGGLSTVYVDVDGAIRPAPRWRLFGHAGVLTPVGGGDSYVRRRERYDLRLGVAAELKHCELHLAWTGTTPSATYPREQPPSRSAVVVGVSYAF
jgi:uncharacterized protein (TIGR02001 family)